MSVAAYLRAHKQQIGGDWEDAVRRDHEPLRGLSRPALIDHLPEVLDGIAAWIEGDKTTAHAAFQALAEGHALQRLGFGVELSTLTAEYSQLRRTLMRRLLAVDSTPAVREELVQLDEALDLAIGEAVRTYVAQREAVRQRFVAILAHDLRSPLAAVHMSAQLVARQDTAASGTAMRILRGVERMQRMIDALIDLAQGSLGGGIPVEPTMLDLAAVCRAAVEEMSAAHPGTPFQLDVSGDLRGAWDEGRVRQVLANLLGNAQRHATGKVTLCAWESEDRETVFTSVTNEGPPITADAQRRIFDPFTRGDAPNRKGLGLGLYIVQQIALAHGAICSVSSTEAGPTFTIAWPRSPAIGGDPRG